MKQYLIYCEYDYYCQGWEATRGYFLVYADSFEEAVSKLKSSGLAENVRHERNMTVF